MADNGKAAPAVARDVGERLRQMRKARGYTLRHVAELLEISPSAVSQIETGVLAPSIARLHEIVSVLGFSVAAVFDDTLDTHPDDFRAGAVPAEDIFLQRFEDAPTLAIAGGVGWTQLAPDTRAGVEVMRIDYRPRSGEPEYRRHAGRDVVVVLEGSIDVSVRFETTTLRVGDSISFPSHLPHRVANPNDVPAAAIWIGARQHAPDAR